MGCKSSKKQDSVLPVVVVGPVGPVGPPPGLGLSEPDSEHWSSSSESSVPETRLDKKSRWWQHYSEHKESASADESDEGEEDLWGNPRVIEQYPTLSAPPIASKSSNERPSGGARETRRVTMEQESGELATTKALRLSKFFGREKQRKEEADMYLQQVLVSHVPPPPPLSMRLGSDEEVVPSSKRRQGRSDSKSSSIRRSKRAHRRSSKSRRTGEKKEKRRRPSKADSKRADKERRRRPSKTDRIEGDNERRRRPSKAESNKGDRERRRRPRRTDSEQDDGERKRRPSKSSKKQKDSDMRRRPSKADSKQGDNERRRRPSKADKEERSHSKHRNWDDGNDEAQRISTDRQSITESVSMARTLGKLTLPPMPPLPPSAPMPPRKVSTSSVISSRDNQNPNSDAMGRSRGRVATAVAAISAMESMSFGSFKSSGPDNNNVNNEKKNNNKKNRHSIINNIINKYRSPTAAPAKTDSMSIYLHPEWPTMSNNNFINGAHSNTQNSFLFGRWSKKRTRFKHKKFHHDFNDQTPNMNIMASSNPEFEAAW